MIAALAIKSLRNRRFSAALTALTIGLAVALLLGVQRLRQESRESFASSVSGTDLIVGARTSPVHLLLHSVFRVGNASNKVSWAGYQRIAALPPVAWTIPLSLGDSHRGFPVLGTTEHYFEHFRFARGRALELAQGRAFADDHDAVLGADVAATLGYRLGEEIVIAHGSGDVAFALHREHPFRVAGILARTGTPVDRAIHVSLEGIDAVHENESGAQNDDPLAAARRAAGQQERGRAITAFLVGLKSRGSALALQREVNESRQEPLTAILPGATLQEVWEVLAAAEKTLLMVSVLVVIMGLAGMLVALLASLSERRREMAVLRAVGARPRDVFALILGEAALLTLVGIALGIAALYLGLSTGKPWLEEHFGLFIALSWPSATEFGLLGLVGVSGILVGLIPAYRSYRMSLADGMTIRT